MIHPYSEAGLADALKDVLADIAKGRARVARDRARYLGHIARVLHPELQTSCTIQFYIDGGYRRMTGAWYIFRNQRPIVVVDQNDYGQPACDWYYHSAECERIAHVIFDALLKDEQTP